MPDAPAPRLSDEQLAGIQARTDAATAGSWWVIEDINHQPVVVGPGVISLAGIFHPPTAAGDAKDNAAFIAHARVDVVLLLDEVKRLRGLLAREGEGWVSVPKEPTDEMMLAAAERHYGKRRVKASGGIRGISMTVAGEDFNFQEAFRRFWAGALAASPSPAPDLRSALEEARDYLRRLEADMIRNDADMAVDETTSPETIADRIDRALAARAPRTGEET